MGAYRGKAIDPVTRAINYTSVSSMNAFDPESDGGCPTKWWYRYVDGKKEPTSPSMQKGIDIAKRIEHYMKTGQDVLDAKLERAALKFMPTPRPARDIPPDTLLVEHDIDTGSVPLAVGGIPLIGAMDIGELGSVTRDSEGNRALIPAGHVEILDWKSTGDIIGRGKTPGELAFDRQLLGYGVWMLDNHPSLARVGVMFSHVYIGTKRFEAVKRSTCVSAEDIRLRWARKTAVLTNMKEAAKAATADDVVPNLGACEAFRGCFMRDSCPHVKTWRTNASKRDLLLGINATKAKEECVSFLNRQRAALGEAPVTVKAEVPAVVTAPAAVVKAKKPWEIVDESTPDEAPAPAAPAAPAPTVTAPVAVAAAENPPPMVYGAVFKPTRVVLKKGVTRKSGDDYLKIEVELEAECSDHAEGMRKLSEAIDKQLESEVGV